MSDRILNAASIGAIALALTALVIALFTITMAPAHGATCATHPGVSHGSVWWRWRDVNGRRCWYPGSRYASRRHSRPAALRQTARETRSPQSVEPAGMSAPAVEPPATRRVRIIPIVNGRTINERVQRAFDKLMIFPVVDEE